MSPLKRLWRVLINADSREATSRSIQNAILETEKTSRAIEILIKALDAAPAGSFRGRVKE